jgi:hypothetical protein
MNKLSLLISACLLGTLAQAQLIDNFSGDLSAYTATRILNNGNHSPVNTYSWEISGGSLQINTTAYVGIEQYALTRADFTLGVGHELTAMYSPLNTGSQDIGLYVGAGTPTTDVRADYVNIYMRNNGQLYSRGFNGSTEFALSGGSSPAVDTLFVARTALDTFDLGYYNAGTRTVLTTRTVANTAIGNAIGFYADVRALGIRGNLDNLTLTVIPEPSVAALMGIGALGLISRLRRK